MPILNPPIANSPIAIVPFGPIGKLVPDHRLGVAQHAVEPSDIRVITQEVEFKVIDIVITCHRMEIPVGENSTDRRGTR